MNNPTMDEVQAFLANTTRAEIAKLASNPETLDRHIRIKFPYKDWDKMDSDTQEATEAAGVSMEVEDRAEEMIHKLIKLHPKEWETVKEVVLKMTGNSYLERFLAPWEDEEEVEQEEENA